MREMLDYSVAVPAAPADLWLSECEGGGLGLLSPGGTCAFWGRTAEPAGAGGALPCAAGLVPSIPLQCGLGGFLVSTKEPTALC